MYKLLCQRINFILLNQKCIFTVYLYVQCHAMIIKQLWSKCRLHMVFPKRVKIDIQLFMGWKALTLPIINLILLNQKWLQSIFMYSVMQ